MDACKDRAKALEMQLGKVCQERDQALGEVNRLAALLEAEYEYWRDMAFRLPHSSLNETLNDYENLKERLSGNMSGKGHISEKFHELRHAIDKFWKNADPDEKTSHPRNATVQAHLEQLGWSAKMAKQGASIIRPKWAPPGRREKETP